MQGELESARQHLQRALATLENIRGRDDFSLIPVLINLAAVSQDEGDYPAAIVHLERARVLIEGKSTPHRDLGLVLLNLGRSLLETGQPALALGHLEQAERLNTLPHGPSIMAAHTRLRLARALHETGGDRARVRELADYATRTLEKAGDEDLIAACRALTQELDEAETPTRHPPAADGQVSDGGGR
jgi:tetratricopeptide (TPR) repeat protein